MTHKTEQAALEMAQASLARVRASNAYPDSHLWQASAVFYDFGPNDPMTGWSETVLAPYAILQRDKKGKPWRKVGECMGSCQHGAEQAAGVDIWDSFKRVVNEYEWISIQTRQHLKALKIKVR